MISLDLSSAIRFSHHRSGWAYCCDGLKKLHSKSGIYCDTFVEKTFLWDLPNYFSDAATHEPIKDIPYKKKWVGFIHNPPNAPEWFDYYNSPQSLIKKKIFQESLKNCVCLISLSKYLKDWLEKHIDIPVIDVKHATPLFHKKWNVDKFLKQKYIPLLQIGYWLRNLTLIRDIECSSRYARIWLPSSYSTAMSLLEIKNKTEIDSKELKYRWNGVSIPNKISNKEYDELMSSSIVCLDLYDSSANNAIIECIARNTPLIINKIPPVVEYLGEDYPLYFADKKQINTMIEDKDLIISANKYLKQMDKSFLSVTKFANEVCSKIEDIL